MTTFDFRSRQAMHATADRGILWFARPGDLVGGMRESGTSIINSLKIRIRITKACCWTVKKMSGGNARMSDEHVRQRQAGNLGKSAGQGGAPKG